MVLTLSATEFHWPEILQAIGVQYGKHFRDAEILSMDWQTKSTYLCPNPVTAVRIFQHQVERFLEYIMSSTRPLGDIKDYVIKKL